MDGVARHRTAIRRLDPSRPLRIALNDGIVHPSAHVFDYGCGHGDDLRYLSSVGIAAFGWDPAFDPDGQRKEADVVQLGYVINVIEHPEERTDVLRAAWGFTQQVLVVAARLTDESPDTVADYSDGCLTRLGTFQKFFTQQELRAWIDTVLGTECVAAAPGVFYVFRDAGRRETFLASRYHRRASVPRQRLSDRRFEEHRDLFASLMAFVNDRGRLPDTEELPAAATLNDMFGSVKRAFATVRRVTGTEHWERVRGERTQDLLVYVALGRFGRRPSIGALPAALQRDIKALFGTYRHVCTVADELLFSAGSVPTIDAACRAASVGKLLPSALYVHVAGLHQLPSVLRVYEGCARVLSGTVEGTTIVKLHRHEPKISYLAYPDFDTQEHPSLAASLRVHLQQRDLKHRDFRDAENPPVLHRKELFVPADYPNRTLFAALTAQEDERGLLQDSSLIGTKTGWEATLKRHQLLIRDHALVPERGAT